MNMMLEKYANLLVHYCLEMQPGERFYLRSTTLAEPLVREVYRAAVKAGAQVEVELDFREKSRILLTQGDEGQLRHVPTLYRKAMEEFDTYLYIMAPFNLREDQNVDARSGRKPSSPS